jgi:hypothetical protein
MPFFPILKTFDAEGFSVIHNYVPNDWEKSNMESKTLWAIYSDGKHWVTKNLGEIHYGMSRQIYYTEFNLTPIDKAYPLIILQFRKTTLEKKLEELPNHEFQYPSVPEWRATTGFSYKNAETSYQGEINPFPPKATLLTFHPFIQFNKTENNLVFVNLEKSPIFRKAKLEIYNAKTHQLIDVVEVRNNSTNTFELDQYGFSPSDLPTFICRSMAGIPFGFGINKESPMLSLEHTHPPASFAVHGERFSVQKRIKEKWFNILSPKDIL